nr:MAG TPA: hypothetical protein [Caudoviricetes sp.]DAP79817.1 MAG TPA: hypothetical protein [Caudoviricetes sp.]
MKSLENVGIQRFQGFFFFRANSEFYEKSGEKPLLLLTYY